MPNMNLVILGAFYFVSEHRAFDLLVEKVNLDRSRLLIEEIGPGKWGDKVAISKQAFDGLPKEQKYWVRKTELDFQMGESRRKIVLESLGQLAKGRKDRSSLEATLAFLQEEYKGLAQTYAAQIKEVEGLADQNKVHSLSVSSSNYLRSIKKKESSLEQP